MDGRVPGACKKKLCDNSVQVALTHCRAPVFKKERGEKCFLV